MPRLPTIADQLFYFTFPHVMRTYLLPAFDFLGPAIRGLLKYGYQILRAQVVPRIFAAVAAFIDPSRSRSPQWETIIIIIPTAIPPLLIPNTDNAPETDIELDDDKVERTTINDPPRPLRTPYHVSATPFAIVIGLPISGNQ